MRTLTLVLTAALAAAACDGRSRNSPADTRSDQAPDASPPAAAGTDTSVAGHANRSNARRDVTLPVGTRLPLRLETGVASDTSSVEDPVRATLREPVLIDGTEILPRGTEVSGVVTAARRSARVKGRALVALRFTTLTLDQEPHRIRTGVISREARGTKAKDAKTIGIPAAGGAAVGAVVGGKKGAAIGAAAGGGAGTAVVLSTRGEEVRLAPGSSLTARLTEAVTVQVPAP
jgi:hypothetical protein